MAKYKFVTPSNIGKGFNRNTQTKQYDINVDGFTTFLTNEGKLKSRILVGDREQSTYIGSGDEYSSVIEGVNRTSHFDIRDIPDVNNLITYFDTDYYFTIPNDVVLEMDTLMQAKNLPAIQSYMKMRSILEVKGVLETRMPSLKGNGSRFFTQTLHISFIGSDTQEHITFKRLNRTDAMTPQNTRPTRLPLYEFMHTYRDSYPQELVATRQPNMSVAFNWHTTGRMLNWDNWVLVSGGQSANTAVTTTRPIKQTGSSIGLNFDTGSFYLGGPDKDILATRKPRSSLVARISGLRHITPEIRDNFKVSKVKLTVVFVSHELVETENISLPTNIKYQITVDNGAKLVLPYDPTILVKDTGIVGNNTNNLVLTFDELLSGMPYEIDLEVHYPTSLSVGQKVRINLDRLEKSNLNIPNKTERTSSLNLEVVNA